MALDPVDTVGHSWTVFSPSTTKAGPQAPLEQEIGSLSRST